jgi:hypothetical protein
VRTDNATICQLPAEAGCSATSCGGALLCASDLRCRSGCQSAVDCASEQVCVSGVCADPMDLDVNGQLPQRGPGPVADAGANLSPDAAAKDSGVDLVVAPADAGAKDGGADLVGTGADATGPAPDVIADIAPTKLPDAGADLVSQPDLPAADLAADKLPSTGPEVNASTADAVVRPDGGGASPVATGCGVPPISTRYFCDDFESGISKWLVSGNDWNTTTTTSRSPDHSATDSPSGKYAAGANLVMTMATSVDLASATAPVLAFWYTLALWSGHGSPGLCEGVMPCDQGHVEVSSDSGTTWTDLVPSHADNVCTTYGCNLTTLGPGSNSTAWTSAQYSLSPYIGKHIKVQFRLESNPSSTPADGWYIDDVEIREAN